MYRLYLFGFFHLTVDERASLPFRSDKTRALLAYLVLEGHSQPIHRQQLIHLFWPDSTERAAQQNLRSALHNLRQIFAPHAWLQADRLTVSFRASVTDFWCDASAFIQQAVQIEEMWRKGDEGALADPLRDCLTLYHGDFLMDLALSECPAFVLWREKTGRSFRRTWDNLHRIESDLLITPHNLPRQTTPFFGRESEIGMIRSRLLRPEFPIISLVGPGGVGKTRLAVAVAAESMKDFPDGVWFAPLEQTQLTDDQQPEKAQEQIALAIGRTIRLPFHDNASPTEQLCSHLQNKRVLLILDSFEHLIPQGGVNFVLTLLPSLSQATLLITSQQRLGLQAESTIWLQGLPVPPPAKNDLTASAAMYSSVQLFSERAERVSPRFALTGENAEDVADICRSVDGLPLGVELAAALAEERSPGQIAWAIRQTIDALTTRMPDVAPRHRALRGVFDYSWRLLPPPLARIFARCAVIPGSFASADAAVVAQAAPGELEALVERSLLRADSAGLYTVHPQLRRFAEAKLYEAGEWEETRTRFLHHYLGKVEQPSGLYWYGIPDHALSQLAQEWPNIRAAWLGAVEAGHLDLLDRTIRGLGFLQERLNFYLEGVALMEETQRQLETLEITDQQKVPDLLWSRVYGWRGFFLTRTGRHAQAIPLAEEATRRAEQAGDSLEVAGSLGVKAIALRLMGRHREAYAISQEALAISRKAALLMNEILAQIDMGQICWQMGNLSEAQTRLEEATQLTRQAGMRLLEGSAQIALATVYTQQGRYYRAKGILEPMVNLARLLGYVGFEGECRLRLMSLHLHLGRYAEAEQCCARLLEIAQDLGALSLSVYGLALRTRLLYAQGKWAEARQVGKEAVVRATEAGELYPLACATLYLGHVYQALGDVKAAEGVYRTGVELWRQRGVVEGTLEPLAGLASLADRAEETAQARAFVEQIVAALPDGYLYHPAMNEPMALYLTCCRILAEEQPEQAARLRTIALTRLQEEAAEIPDEAARRHFLTAIPAHREVEIGDR
ncbi:MAG: tetratricopeptide repeat protein [Caldilineaceae bacterium]|nr:tetratricopeptide repeat protein [Caldilineaceae bacterium]